MGGRTGIRPVKNIRGWWWALVSLDGVAPSWMVSVSASVNLPLHHKVQKFSSGTGSQGAPGKRAVKQLWYLDRLLGSLSSCSFIAHVIRFSSR